MTHKERYPDPGKLARLIRAETRTDIHKLMKDIAKELLAESGGNTRATYEYFSPVYDELYHAILFEQIAIRKETRELLEMLATPLFGKDPEEQKRIIDEYMD